MLRFFLRLLGYLIVGAGFVALVLDGVRSIANLTLGFTPFADIAASVLRERYAALKPAIEQIHPLVWDPVVSSLMLLPAFVIAFAIGFLLLWLARAPDPGIGFVTRA